jgi:hypothetical protein
VLQHSALPMRAKRKPAGMMNIPAGLLPPGTLFQISA